MFSTYRLMDVDMMDRVSEVYGLLFTVPESLKIPMPPTTPELVSKGSYLFPLSTKDSDVHQKKEYHSGC